MCFYLDGGGEPTSHHLYSIKCQRQSEQRSFKMTGAGEGGSFF